MNDVRSTVTAVSRSDWGRIVSGLIRLTGDWTLAEDATQDAFATALQRWSADGIPDNPAAWLTTTARNRAIDRLRSAASERTRAKEVAIMESLERGSGQDIEDDRLRLIFTCAHPALPLPARVALTLRTVAGLTVPEIASAFLVPESTMAQRLVRARRKIEEAGIPYRVPPAELLGERLAGVLAVLYLVFNQGYSAVARNELAASALSLAGAVVELMPREDEARGLLALLVLQNSRRDARVGPQGELLTLEEQDRSLWRRDEISHGRALLPASGGPYAIQAAIAACHARAFSAADTDWDEIVGLYEVLLSRMPSPVIELNHAIAIGMRDGPDAGLELLSALTLDGYRWLPAAQADLLLRAGRTAEAADRFRETIALTTSDLERADLERRLAELES
ncbi:MAG TPA: sigma-70 family RNA polymerase sigma factor [Galbitalea sp.]|nr:sigma-70 family RNA polymerase sigma factor [Galbitalea sp.]